MTRTHWFEPLYCGVCGTHIGSKPGQGAVVGLRCSDRVCRILEPSGVTDERNAVLVSFARAGIPAAKLAVLFHLSRQRVYQIYHDYTRGL